MSSSIQPQLEFKTYDEAVDWIVNLKLHGIKPGLSRMQAIMEKLGHPERKLRFIHIAGTNGKGSTCAFLSHTLHECGYDVGSFTSPYLEKYTERIQYNGQHIPAEELVRLCNLLKPHIDDIAHTALGSPTMFEVSTGLAILYFSQVVHPDIIVWETGLGGRFDATNIIHPLVTIITNIGYDHMDILGDTLAEIAYEKAGILKSGVPLVTAVQSLEAQQVIKQAAQAKQVSVYALGEQFGYQSLKVSQTEQTFDFQGPFRAIPQVTIRLQGEHQLQNASVALMTLETLRQYYAFNVEENELKKGMIESSWPGRLEMISGQPPILLDGAHNPEGAKALAHALQNVYPHQKLHMMIGMLANKSHEAFLQSILPLLQTLIVTEPEFPRKADAHCLADKAQILIHNYSFSVQLRIEPDWRKALQVLQSFHQNQDLCVVTGSLYLVSDVRAVLLNHTSSEKGW